MTLRIGILGGTFDPVRNAHLAIARLAREQLQAEKILWIPTRAPGYREAPVAAAKHRVAMLRLALAGEPRYQIDERELSPQASGYTYDTVLALKRENPGPTLTLLMGADQYEKRESWHRWPELAKLCRIAVIERPDFPKPQGDVIQLPLAPLAISASDIRTRIAHREDVAAMLPAPVLSYIEQYGLYR